jgi:hypothetical protein
MLKIAIERNGEWWERDPPPTFFDELRESGANRLRIAVPRSERDLLRRLATHLEPPVQLLYVLHTSRVEGPLGRYQSGEMSKDELDAFLKRFGDFLSSDARADLWVRSAASGDFLVWDRHNDIFGYGDMAKIKDELRGAGFVETLAEPLGEHVHFYRAEFDADAAALLGALRWRRTPLQPQDEQYVAPLANEP